MNIRDKIIKLLYIVSCGFICFEIIFWTLAEFSNFTEKKEAILYIAIALPIIVALINIVYLIKHKTPDVKITLFNYLCLILQPLKEPLFMYIIYSFMFFYENLTGKTLF